MPQMKPCLYVSDKDLPEIKDWKIGEDYEIMVKVKMTSVSKNQMGFNACLDVEEIMVPEEEKDIKEMDAEDFAEYSANARKKGYL